MRPVLVVASFAAVLLAAAPAVAQPAAPQPFSYEDLIRLNRLSDPQVSPDGSQVVYAVRATDLEANRGVTSLFLQPLAGDAPARRLAISDGGVFAARWGQNGRLYFLSGRSGSTQVWMTDATGAEAVQVTDLPHDVQTYRLSPTGDRLAVSLAVGPAVSMTAPPRGTGLVYDRLFARHWDSWGDGTRNHVFTQALGPDGRATGPVAWVTLGFDGDTPSKPFGDEGDYTFTRDGRSIIFSAREAGRTEAWSTDFDLYTTAADAHATGTFENLTEANPAWDAGPVISPDGRTLAYRAMAR